MFEENGLLKWFYFLEEEFFDDKEMIIFDYLEEFRD